MIRRLRYWRRRWCAWRGHPQADWSPIVIRDCQPDIWDGEKITKGQEIIIRAYRCVKHDRKDRL